MRENEQLSTLLEELQFNRDVQNRSIAKAFQVSLALFREHLVDS